MTLTRPNLLRLAVPPLVFAALLAALLLANRSSQPPGAPADANGVDLPALSGSTVEQIETLQRAARESPGSAGGYALLGDAYLQRARETGDPSFYTRADRSYGAALRRDPRDLTALIGAGTLANTRHDFSQGLRLGLEAHRLAPDLVRPYTVIADAQIELGRYGAAGRTIQRAVDLKPTLATYARASYYDELNGDLAGAAEAMALAVSAGAGSPENVAYVQTLLGDLELARGRVGAARDAYREALAAGSESQRAAGRGPGSPDERDPAASPAADAALAYPPALAGLARVDIARGRLGRAIGRLRAAGERVPLTSTLTLLAETELAAGRDEAARLDLSVVRAQRRLLRSAGTVPDAEAVVFEATHGSPRAAVVLGRRVWGSAPGVRSADALGWALTRAGRPEPGLAWARRALRLGSRDPLFHFHAGMAARAAGHAPLARRELGLALRLNPGFSPWLARKAREALR
jgi:tetratricopeptide (TPR) repeat protein